MDTNPQRISAAESEVMKVLWADSPKPAEDVLAILAKDHGWAEGTVTTLLNRLLTKGAIAAVLAKVDLKDTLVVVTADHSHGLVISGYAARNSPILGMAGNEGDPAIAGDGKAYTTLMFATGPGGPTGDATRNDPAKEDLDDVDYHQQATVNLPSAAHAGEDVGVFADGPQAFLLRGVVEESYIFQVMRHAFGFDAISPPAVAAPAGAPKVKKRWPC